MSVSVGPKQKLAEIARRTRTLRLAEELRYASDVLRSELGNRKARRQGLPLPPRRVMYETVGHVDFARYLSLGRHCADFVSERLRAFRGDSLLDVLEWGAGPGRVIRHLGSTLDGSTRLYAADYDPAAVSWGTRNLAQIRFVRNGLDPPLPFDDEAFDAVYALSVFTHLSMPAHESWLAEIRRVLRPNGVFLFTTHGNAFYPLLTRTERESFDAGRMVVRSSEREGSRTFTTFHPPAAIEEVLGSEWSVLLFEESPDDRVMGGQDVWALRCER